MLNVNDVRSYIFTSIFTCFFIITITAILYLVVDATEADRPMKYFVRNEYTKQLNVLYATCCYNLSRFYEVHELKTSISFKLACNICRLQTYDAHNIGLTRTTPRSYPVPEITRISILARCCELRRKLATFFICSLLIDIIRNVGRKKNRYNFKRHPYKIVKCVKCV